MKRARKSSNRISWATGLNLCQVKLFLSEECPSKVGQKYQDHLQAKTSSMSHSSTTEYNDLPPGFECNQFLNQSKDELLNIPRINWRCPPPFVFSDRWQVAAGEESRQKEDQKLRELRVLEALYPRLSAIPPSPSISLEVEEEEDFDDNLTPIIPLEEVVEPMDNKPELAATATTIPIQCSNNTSSNSVASPACGNPLPEKLPRSEADLAAAAAVVAAIVNSNQQGSLIDMDLLVKIFNDPKLIEKLVNDHKTAATTGSASSNTHTSGLKPASAPSVPLSTSQNPLLGAVSDWQSEKDTEVRSTSSGVHPSVSLSAKHVGSTSSGIHPCVSLSANQGLCTTLDSSSLSTPGEPVGLLSASGMNKPVVPEKPATPLISTSRPMLAKPVAIPSVPSSTPDMQRPVNRNFHHMSNRVLPTLDTHPPQKDTILASGAKQAASLLASIPMNSGGNLQHPVTNQVRSSASTKPYQASTGNYSAHAVKDANYLKDLIRQHGSDKQETQDLQLGIRHNSNFHDQKSVHHNNIAGEVKFKIPKTCMFFKTSRGCRNGASCPFQHDMSVQWEDDIVLGPQNAKRLKLGGPEIKGRI